jgi:hypothetical protein
MTPQEMQVKIEELTSQVEELLSWKERRETQQLSYPVDDASRNALKAVVSTGTGTSALTQILSGVPGAVPKAYAKTFFVEIDGVLAEIPSLI